MQPPVANREMRLQSLCLLGDRGGRPVVQNSPAVETRVEVRIADQLGGLEDQLAIDEVQDDVTNLPCSAVLESRRASEQELECFAGSLPSTPYRPIAEIDANERDRQLLTRVGIFVETFAGFGQSAGVCRELRRHALAWTAPLA